MGAKISGLLNSWRLVATLSITIVLIAVGILSWHDFDIEGIRAVIRVTARISLLLFCLAFSAAALHSSWPNAWTRWQRVNRRYLGVSFAVSHTVHAIGIISFAILAPEQFRQSVNLGSFIFGGTAYAFIIAMTATSFDKTASWIGTRMWRNLHSVGAHFIWLTFLISSGKRVVNSPFYWLLIIVLILVIGIRLANYRFLRTSTINRPG
ncbi:MAG: hypothetical protein AB1489_33350 [Acidobacteriota bacterium]